MPHARTFVDIGSNKGYSGARFYALWNPEMGLDEKVGELFLPAAARCALFFATRW